MASLRDIAREAGVSVATVSRALSNSGPVSDALRSKVIREADRVGYALPAVPVVSTGRIGLAYPGTPVNPEFGGFDSAVVCGVNRGAFEQRFDVAFVNILADKRDRETYSQFFRRKGLDAIVLRTYADRRYVCEGIAAEGFPCVVLADRFEGGEVNFLCTDARGAWSRAVEHLLHLGHERVALVVHKVQDRDHLERREVFDLVTGSNGLRIPSDFVVEVIADADGGASAVSRLMTLPEPPTAIMFTDPLATLGGLRRAHELGIQVPDELSIVGFDDAQLRKLTHPIYTSVCQDAEGLAYAAARWLAEGIKSGGVGELQEFRDAYFEVNHTTAAPASRPVRVSPNGRRLAPSTHIGREPDAPLRGRQDR